MLLRRRRVLFEREGLEIHFRRGLGALAGTRELLTPTTLALSAAMGFDDQEVRPFGRHLTGIRVQGVRRRAPWRRLPAGLAYGADPSLTERLFDSYGSSKQPFLFDDADLASVDGREPALALLRFADLGIDDVKLVEEGEDDTSLTAQPRRRLRFMHRVEGQEVPFDLAEESAGTQAWFALIGHALTALRGGQVLLFEVRHLASGLIHCGGQIESVVQRRLQGRLRTRTEAPLPRCRVVTWHRRLSDRRPP